MKISRWWVFIGVILLWLGTIAVVPAIYHTWPENPGTFGDMFGFINALFSGLAFAGIIYTIFLQSEELGLQREELKATREELKGQKEQLEKQNKTLSKQAFENTFFQLLKTFNAMVYNINNIQFVTSSTSSFSSMAKMGKDFSDMSQNIESFIIGQGISETEEIKRRYLELYTQHESKIGHYFKILYNIIKFIDTSDETNKKFYVDIIRAQLSSPELLLIYYNCTLGKGKEKLAPLVVKYNLLKHMPQNEITEKIKLSENINEKN